MPRLGDCRSTLLESIEQRYGPLPAPATVDGSSSFEAIVRIALGLVAESKLASSAFDALRDAGLIDPEALAGVDLLEIDEIFQQARVRLASKALKPLQRIARWASDRQFDADAVARLTTESIRDDWRSLNGVGPATADALLLFALRRPTIPVHRAGYRILVRHGWLDPSSDYDDARSVLESIAPDDPLALAQLSLAFEKLGRDHCKPSAPNCDGCPLQPLLPEAGPVESS